MNKSEELQLTKDFIKWTVMTSAERQFIVPEYDKTNPKHDILFLAIEELRKEGLIIKKILDNKTIITLKSGF